MRRTDDNSQDCFILGAIHPDAIEICDGIDLDAPIFKTLTVLARSINIETLPSNTEEKSSALKLYSNPSSGQFMVDLHVAERINGTAKLQLIDITGRTVYVANAVINNGVLQKKVSISSLLSSGFYTVTIIANGKSYFAKLIYGK